MSLLLSAFAVLRVGLVPSLGALLPFIFMGTLLATIDFKSLRLPFSLVLPSAIFLLSAFALIALFSGQWNNYGRAVLGGVLYLSMMFMIVVLSNGGMGGGDMMIALPLGIVLGWFGWYHLFLGAIAGPILNVLVLGYYSIRHPHQGAVPFGPAMLLGAYLPLVLLS